jgi:hypothetical protein
MQNPIFISFVLWSESLKHIIDLVKNISDN